MRRYPHPTVTAAIPAALLAAGLLAACADAPRTVAVIGHRGASAEAPEHTFAAWDRAIADGADWLEFDLQRTRDSVLVVIHDDSLDRTARGPAADCSGLVRERTIAQLASCNVTRWFAEERPEAAWVDSADGRIPTLDAVLTRYRGRALYIELKSPESAPGMLEQFHAVLVRDGLVREGEVPARLLVQSFSPAALERFHVLAPQVRLVQLLGDSIPDTAVDTAIARIARYAAGIGPSGRILTPRLLEAARAHGLLVHVYTVNEEAQMRALIDLGVDGLFTDRPGLLRRVLAAR